MMDVGKNVRRNSKAVAKLSDSVQGMITNWTEQQFPYFVETMELIRENAPVKYAQLFLKMVELGIIRQTDINVNVNYQRDREDLQALVRTKLSLPDSGTYTPYEEVTPVPVTQKKEK